MDLVGFALILGLVAYRVWRLIGADTITEKLREKLPNSVQDFMECPWCLGSWIAFITVGIIAFIDAIDLTTAVLLALASAAITGLIGERA